MFLTLPFFLSIHELWFILSSCRRTLGKACSRAAAECQFHTSVHSATLKPVVNVDGFKGIFL